MSRIVAVPELELDPHSERTLQQQIYSQMAEAIRSGQLRSGVRLPSSRVLAELLNVSRNTVVNAYEQLLEGGLISTKVGSGSIVTHASTNVPNFLNLRRTVRDAHYPMTTVRFSDPDGTTLYFNCAR